MPNRRVLDAADRPQELARELGEEAGVAEVYRRHGAQVSRWADRLAGPGFDLEDIVHDVFLVVQRRLSEFRGDAQLTTWLYEITVRVVQGRRRRTRRQKWMARFWPEGGSTNGSEELEVADQGASPIETLERRQATQLLYRLLDQLDEKYRTAVVLFELEGLPCQDIAKITGTSVANVWARVSRGRQMLIEAFARWEGA